MRQPMAVLPHQEGCVSRGHGIAGTNKERWHVGYRTTGLCSACASGMKLRGNGLLPERKMPVRVGGRKWPDDCAPDVYTP
jgi:hypothetical protein